MTFVFDDSALYHQIKTPRRVWCRQGLNSRSLIQPLETLLVELTGTHGFIFFQVHVVDHVKVYFF